MTGGGQWHNDKRANMVIMAGGKSIVAMSGERLGRLILTNRKAVLIVILRSLKGDVRINRTAGKKNKNTEIQIKCIRNITLT